MPHTCAIKTCRYTTRHGDGRSMHKFPTVQALRVAWMSACGISPSFATQSSKICGSHFLRTDYGPSGHTLLDSAVPSQNLPAPMEEGVDCPSTPPPSSSGQTLTTATGSKMATNDPAEDELSIPRASMNKMIKEVLPKIRVANESRELILNCCKEFILLLSSEANAVCNEQNRRTINPDHVLIGLDKLGFNDYRQEVEEVARECKDITAKRRRQSTRLENLGIPEEELLRQQQELFARARHEQMLADQQQLQQLQADSEMHAAVQAAANSDDEDDYS